VSQLLQGGLERYGILPYDSALEMWSSRVTNFFAVDMVLTGYGLEMYLIFRGVVVEGVAP